MYEESITSPLLILVLFST